MRRFLPWMSETPIAHHTHIISHLLRTAWHAYNTITLVVALQPTEKKIEESKLVLEGLVQYYHVVTEEEKSRQLVDLLDNLDFNQVRLDTVY
jgi:hypothetical protein